LYPLGYSDLIFLTVSLGTFYLDVNIHNQYFTLIITNSSFVFEYY
jgi:hypothetical protein